MSTILKEEMALLVECEDCGQKFQIGVAEAAQQVTHKKKFDVNGRSIFLTYYDCPKCGRRHYVQIDDARSMEKLKDVSRQFVKLSVAKKKGKTVPQKQSDKFKKARQHLSDYRMDLMKQYTGTVLKDEETGQTFELRFSV